MSCQHDSDGKCRCVKPDDTCCKEIGLYGKHSHDLKKKYLNITGFYDIDVFLDDVFDTMAKKGHDYRQGNDADLLHNFRTVADAVGTDMEKVWFTYFYKHYSAMVTYIKEGGQSESEPIEGRIKDQIVYLVLFWKMVQERKRQAELDRPKGVEVRAEDLDLQAGSQKAFGGEELQALIEEKAAEIRAFMKEPTRLKSSATLDVPVGGKVVEVDPQRMYKLAGGAGTFVPPEVKRRAGEIHRKLEARDQEAATPLGGYVTERKVDIGLGFGQDERAVRKALTETQPLHEREAGKPMFSDEEDEIQQGRAANGSFDGPVPTDIPF